MKNYKKSFGDRVFDLAIYLFILFVLVVTLYPLIYIFSMSISSPIAAARGDVVLLPKGFDLTALNRVLADKQIFTYYFNTLWFTVVGTVGGIIEVSDNGFDSGNSGGPAFSIVNGKVESVGIVSYQNGSKGKIGGLVSVTQLR